jgi:hypothetical protein
VTGGVCRSVAQPQSKETSTETRVIVVRRIRFIFILRQVWRRVVVQESKAMIKPGLRHFATAPGEDKAIKLQSH